MNIHHMSLGTESWLVAKDADTDGESRWAMTYGSQHRQADGTIHRQVDLSIRTGSLPWDGPYTDYRYASLTISPEEARMLAARLLDAADAADERSPEDLPIRYDLTPKGREVAV